MPHDELLKMICLLTISKVLYELIFMPITISLVKYLKRAENLDVYEKPSFKKILPSWE
jgi:hypothetical protein